MISIEFVKVRPQVSRRRTPNTRGSVPLSKSTYHSHTGVDLRNGRGPLGSQSTGGAQAAAANGMKDGGREARPLIGTVPEELQETAELVWKQGKEFVNECYEQLKS